MLTTAAIATTRDVVIPIRSRQLVVFTIPGPLGRSIPIRPVVEIRLAFRRATTPAALFVTIFITVFTATRTTTPTPTPTATPAAPFVMNVIAVFAGSRASAAPRQGTGVGGLVPW
jgi:hypothetical protein